MVDILDVANEMQINIVAEADAIHKYDNALKVIDESELDQETKIETINKISEIISDELNHIEKLKEIYVSLTGIEPNKN